MRVTSALGKLEMNATNCWRLLCDFWAGQGGKVWNQLETFLCEIRGGQDGHGCKQFRRRFLVEI